MQNLLNFISTSSHHLKPPMRDGSQFACMRFHPQINGGVSLDNAIDAQ